MSPKDLLSATEIAVIDIIDEYGPSTIDTLSAHTYCPNNELIPHLNNLESKQMLVTAKSGNADIYDIPQKLK